MSFLRSTPPLGNRLASALFLMCFSLLFAQAHSTNIARDNKPGQAGRERVSLNDGWKFSRFVSDPDSLSYNTTLKPWILPSANDFINGTKYKRPSVAGDQPAQRGKEQGR
ncbi:hypothetical protein C8A05DRAFT_30624 [Staphylotrichum tortipilum]|uniref:Beta-galactosidase n=1 Tax=Staphylotrichum tortipilum TaxID=2831512 RepID=A0AAN6MT95_9PEZI|nr:hypothetical protein C8A05DRAFT_30624 [Staphylotrichum longicolle]